MSKQVNPRGKKAHGTFRKKRHPKSRFLKNVQNNKV
jgi:hypothetical protein